MARTGTPTGRVAIPLPALSLERLTELSAAAGIGEAETVYAAEDARERLAELVREEQKQMALSAFNSGFLPNSGSSYPSGGGGLAEVIINRGVDLATAIINRGNQPAQIPSITGGTHQLPIPSPTSPGSIAVSGPAGIHMTRGTDISLAAFAPQGGWPTNKDGTPRRVRRDGRPWKRPAMQVTNPRALSRAMRRVEGFAFLAKRTIRFTKKVKMVSKRKR